MYKTEMKGRKFGAFCQYDLLFLFLNFSKF